MLAWEKLSHDRLDVEHRRSIYCIEFCYDQLGAFDSNDAADGAADSIGAILATLREDANGWPGCIVPRMPSTSNDLRWLDLMEEEQDFHMGKFGQPLQRFSRELFRKGDAGFLSTPKIIFRVRTNRLDKPYRFDLRTHRDDPFRDAERSSLCSFSDDNKAATRG
jgi:hypothetical protein